MSASCSLDIMYEKSAEEKHDHDGHAQCDSLEHSSNSPGMPGLDGPATIMNLVSFLLNKSPTSYIKSI